MDIPGRASRELVQRAPDPHDRRKVLVVMSEKAERLAARVYGPVRDAGVRMLSKYTVEEMKVILRFLQETIKLQEELHERLAKRRGV